jgi:hypothetical protein
MAGVTQDKVERLRDLSLEELRAQWQRQMRTPAPACFKSDLLFRTLAYQLQVKAFGGLDRATERLLDRLAEAKDPGAVLASLRRRRIKPGTELIREWAGTAHRVVVTEGGFAYADRSAYHRHELERTALLRPAAGETRRPGHRPHGGEAAARPPAWPPP